MGSRMVNILDHCTDAPIERYEPGGVLIDEGRRSGRLFVLAEGEVEVLRGGTSVAVISEAGAVFGRCRCSSTSRTPPRSGRARRWR